MKETIRIGSGAAWWGDRVEPAAQNAEQGDLDYLCFETMAEATVSAAPDIPTLAEAGVPGYEMSAWFGLFAPAGTPKPLVDDLNKHIVAILKTPEMQQKLLDLGAQPVGDSPEQFAAYVRSDNKKWQEVGNKQP